jgi:hypothetical protein
MRAITSPARLLFDKQSDPESIRYHACIDASAMWR